MPMEAASENEGIAGMSSQSLQSAESS